MTSISSLWSVDAIRLCRRLQAIGRIVAVSYSWHDGFGVARGERRATRKLAAKPQVGQNVVMFRPRPPKVDARLARVDRDGSAARISGTEWRILAARVSPRAFIPLLFTFANLKSVIVQESESIVGTEITLDVGGIAVTYSKNHMGFDHGSLFQEADRRTVRSDQLDYEHYERGEADPTSAEIAFSRSLKNTLPRLELLGFDLKRLRREYDAVAESWDAERRSSLDECDKNYPDLMTFDEFQQFATQHAIEDLDDTFVLDSGEAAKKRIRGRFSETALARLPNYEPYDIHAYSERSFFGELVNILHPYSVMRLVAEQKANENVAVTWQYGPLVVSGWATKEEFVPEARRTETFLIATEGSSDVHILQHALALLRPGIVDFFRFIDVSESHPFSGTGNLVKFAEGLAKIDVQNKILFLFDNDAEGVEAHEKVSRFNLPANMRATMLPELAAFRTFQAEGPEGLREADINRRAAGIECYLDLSVGDFPAAKVRWTNYKPTCRTYHGALEYKESYVKGFLKQTTATIADGTYDVNKIMNVLDLIAAECSAMAASAETQR